MSLHRRLLLFLVSGAVLAWAVALAISVPSARHEVNELFDTELIRLARQVQSLLAALDLSREQVDIRPDSLGPEPLPSGEADMDDLAIAVWDREGRLQFTDREGASLLRQEDRAGFVDMRIDGEPWRVYYLQSFDGDWLVAAGQKSYERDEMVYEFVLSQLLPWLLVLPGLVLALTLAVHRALAPVERLVGDLGSRSAHDLEPIAARDVPADLRPMIDAVNALFERISGTLARERAFTEDAAHELRTPLAVLRAQWDVLRRTEPGPERTAAAVRFGSGLERMERLVTQMLALSRLEAGGLVVRRHPVDWREVVEQVFSDCLRLAEARGIELACEWPAGNEAPLPLHGDPDLLKAMLRNLVDNAIRYAPVGSTATVRFAADRIEVENEGPGLTFEALARLGERFFRPEGQDQAGSGLGVSIVERIAALHGLEANWAPRTAGDGMLVTLRAAAASVPATSVGAPSAAARGPLRDDRYRQSGDPGAAAPRSRARGT
ncbi:MAG: two-component sensor histidine kinase [Limnobacter sp.]|nr:two-component sensor histidine kinase [Limnobacter sp.]